MASLDNLRNFMVVVTSKNASTCIIHVRYDEAYMLKNEDFVCSELDKSTSDLALILFAIRHLGSTTRNGTFIT